jgi:hypothetical protein
MARRGGGERGEDEDGIGEEKDDRRGVAWRRKTVDGSTRLAASDVSLTYFFLQNVWYQVLSFHVWHAIILSCEECFFF